MSKPTPEQIAEWKQALEDLRAEIEALQSDATDLEDKIWDAEHPEQAAEMGRETWEDEDEK